MTAAN